MEKAYRLTKRQYFDKVYRKGKSAANHQFVVYYAARPGQSVFRLGISVSKKLGNAVVRNRIRRVVKEIVRLNKHVVPVGFDLIVIARKPAVSLSYHEMQKCLFHALKRTGLMQSKTMDRGRT